MEISPRQDKLSVLIYLNKNNLYIKLNGRNFMINIKNNDF